MEKVLFDCDYTTVDGKAVIRLFYKTKNGWEIERDENFTPYFYAIPKTDASELEKDLRGIEDVLKASVLEKNSVKGPVNVVRVETSHPAKVPSLREFVGELPSCATVMEADIPFHRRYLIDKQLIPMQGVEEFNPTIAAFDIEVYLPHGSIDVKRDPVTMLSYADNRGVSKVAVLKEKKILDDPRVEYIGSEKKLLEKLGQWVKEHDVDILVGYNTDNFDVPYILERAEINKTNIILGVDDSPIRLKQAGMNKESYIKGRQHVDLYSVVRQLFNIPRYRLEDVYEEIAGKEKKDLELDEMNSYWASGKPEDFQQLVDYSISDVEACITIANTVIGLHYELSRIVGQPLGESSRMGSGMRVEYFLMRKAFTQNILVPNKPVQGVVGDRLGNPVKGAFVVDPDKGIHDNILLFDFRSLYPSIIISHNVDPAMLDCDCCTKEEANTSPNGHRFCAKRKGFISTVLREIIEKRIEIKGKMKKEADPQKKKIYDVQQQALKILANSAYGYYGFAMARWYSRECAASITGWGRKYIHETIEDAEKAGFQVIYGDTDSVYLKYPKDIPLKEIEEKAITFMKDVNKKLPEAMELEFEGSYPRGVFITKKRYALIDGEGKLTVKGLETRRRDWAEIAKKTQEDVLNAILKDKNPEKAANIVKATIERVKSGKVPLDELVIHTQLTRKIGDYVAEGPHVAAAKKAMKEGGQDFGDGSMISYIVTSRPGKKIGDKAEIIENVKEGEYDSDYYINNQILPAVMRVLEALDYSEDELKGKGKQMSLGDW
ncbi:MAG TPA: DNA polymerase [Candidatus Altiarchaeales archaeon]|nr:DNA polymerase [Candidatus Altiarchaeales archaeon]